MAKNTSGPARTRPVLVTTAIVVHMPEDREDGFTFVEPYGERLRRAIEGAFRQSPEVEYPGAIEFRDLSDQTENVGRCERCGDWISDYTRPDYLMGLGGGRRIDGVFLCDQCETFGLEQERSHTAPPST
jgi:hypothetical protein